MLYKLENDLALVFFFLPFDNALRHSGADSCFMH